MKNIREPYLFSETGGSHSPSLALVTLSRDNPREVEKTLSSISHQDREPNHVLVVDGSNELNRATIRDMCGRYGSDYVWLEPRGIYPAMQASLGMVTMFDYVWWVNSSDWLLGRQSISAVLSALLDREPDLDPPHWLVGNLVRLNGLRFNLHRIPSSGSEFIAWLRAGKAGFPHPSCVFRTSSLERIGGYQAKFSVADDYYTALRMTYEYGAPLVVSTALACHQVGGFTAKHLVRHFFNKSGARIATGPWFTLFLEMVRLPIFALQQVASRLKLSSARSSKDIPVFAHFCGRQDLRLWPQCCDEALQAGGNQDPLPNA